MYTYVYINVYMYYNTSVSVTQYKCNKNASQYINGVVTLVCAGSKLNKSFNKSTKKNSQIFANLIAIMHKFY